MKATITLYVIILLLGLFGMNYAFSQTPPTEYITADVISATPYYVYDTRREPEQHCYSVEVPVQQYHQRQYEQPSATNAIIGAIVGGAIGNELGHSKVNKQYGTVIGSTLGASIGADITRRNNSRHYTTQRYRQEQRCETQYRTYRDQKLGGYTVRYNYKGQEYTTQTTQDPGRTIQLRVSVQPLR